MFTRAVASMYALPTKHAHANVDQCLIPSVSMPLRGVGLLLQRREHGTQNQRHKTPTIQFTLDGPAENVQWAKPNH